MRKLNTTINRTLFQSALNGFRTDPCDVWVWMDVSVMWAQKAFIVSYICTLHWCFCNISYLCHSNNDFPLVVLSIAQGIRVIVNRVENHRLFIHTVYSRNERTNELNSCCLFRKLLIVWLDPDRSFTNIIRNFMQFRWISFILWALPWSFSVWKLKWCEPDNGNDQKRLPTLKQRVENAFSLKCLLF